MIIVSGTFLRWAIFFSMSSMRLLTVIRRFMWNCCSAMTERVVEEGSFSLRIPVRFNPLCNKSWAQEGQLALSMDFCVFVFICGVVEWMLSMYCHGSFCRYLQSVFMPGGRSTWGCHPGFAGVLFPLPYDEIAVIWVPCRAFIKYTIFSSGHKCAISMHFRI